MSSVLISLGAALHSLMPAAVRSHGKHKRSRSMPTSRVHPIVADFQYQLRDKVQILMQQQQEPESYNFSAAWLAQALEVVLFIYSSLKDLYPHMQMDNNTDAKWLSRHMDDLVSLLDVCNVLKENMSEIKKHNMSVQIALHALLHAHSQIPSVLSHHVVKAQNSLGNCMEELRKNKDTESKLAKCMSTLKRMAHSLHSTTATTTSLGRSGVEEAINEAKGITIFACTALVAALSPSNIPCRSFMPVVGFLKKKNKISPSSLRPLMDINCMTNMMQQKLKEAMEMQRRSPSSFKFLLHEMNKADITVGNLHKLLEGYIMKKTSKTSSNMEDEIREFIHAVNMCTTELDSALTHID